MSWWRAVQYRAKLAGADAPFAESPEAGATFTLRDGHLCAGLGVAIRTMKLGEEVSLKLSPEYAFGAEGKVGLLPACTCVI